MQNGKQMANIGSSSWLHPIHVCKYHSTAEQVTTIMGLKTTDMYFLNIRGGQKSEIKVQAGLVLSRGSEGEVVPCLSPGNSLLVVSGSPLHSLACGNITPMSASAFTRTSSSLNSCVQMSLCLQGHQSLD